MTSEQPATAESATAEEALRTWDSATALLFNHVTQELHGHSYSQSYESALALTAARSALEAVVCPDLRAVDILATISALPLCGPCDDAIFSHAYSLFLELQTEPLSYEFIHTTAQSPDRFAFWRAQETSALSACVYATGCLLGILAPIGRSHTQCVIRAALDAASSLTFREFAISALDAPLGPTNSVIPRWSRARENHLYTILSDAASHAAQNP